jgi:SAM-dependent methyltransferase
LPVSDWTNPRRPGDESLLSRCAMATLDIGCGPGRLAAALSATGVLALGVDVSPGAVASARASGARAICRSVFDPLPGAGTWDHALLADGNIGIGGDPVALLSRVRSLLGPHGNVLVEVGAPGSVTRRLTLQLADDAGWMSTRFRWALVSLDGLDHIAAEARMRVTETWSASGRWFTALRATRAAGGYWPRTS